MTATDKKVALVGVGYWGSKLLRNLVNLAGTEGVVAVDSNLDALKQAYAAYPGLPTVLTLDEALEDPAVDSVVVATQMSTHHALASRALQAGRHVLVEKPLAASVTEAEELVAIAADCDRRLMVGHTFLFSPRVEKLARIIEEDQAGQIHYITSDRLNLGLFRPDANVIWDLGPHDFSIVFHLIGEFPMRVQTAARSLLPKGIPDVAFMNLWFPSGIIASINLSWMAPRKERRMVIVGERAMVHFDDTDAEEPVKIFDKGVDRLEGDDFGSYQLTYRHGDTVAPFVDADEPLAKELSCFLDVARNGGSVISDGRFGLEVVRALEAADLSWQRNGQPVEL